MMRSGEDRRSALITGISGQDGSYLAEELMNRGWDVHGIVRPGSDPPDSLLDNGIALYEWDLTSDLRESEILAMARPEFVFHLAGVSSVWRSWQDPWATCQANSLGIANLVSACIEFGTSTDSKIRLVNASSAEIFGAGDGSIRDEGSPIAPTTPYGVTKAFGHNLVRVFRESGLFASNAILFNHESPRRGVDFVTRKITRAVARISRGETAPLKLGRIDVRRDWGWAPDYVDCLIRMATAPEPDDFVVATGIAHSIEEFLELAFRVVGIADWKQYVEYDKSMSRQGDASVMVGDASKAASVLGWKPNIGFEQVVEKMVVEDLRLLDEG